MGVPIPEPKKLPYLVRVQIEQERLAYLAARQESAARYEAAETCGRLTKKGRPCRGLASKETGLCPGHQLQVDAENDRGAA